MSLGPKKEEGLRWQDIQGQGTSCVSRVLTDRIRALRARPALCIRHELQYFQNAAIYLLR